MKKTFIKLLTLAVGIVSASIILNTKQAQALRGTSADLNAIARYDGINLCYTKGKIQGSEIYKANFDSNNPGAIIKSSGNVVLPTLKDNSVSEKCDKAIESAGKVDTLEKYGYKADADSSTESKASITLSDIVIDADIKKTIKASGEITCSAEKKYQKAFLWQSAYYYYSVSNCVGSLQYESVKETSGDNAGKIYNFRVYYSGGSLNIESSDTTLAWTSISLISMQLKNKNVDLGSALSWNVKQKLKDDTSQLYNQYLSDHNTSNGKLSGGEATVKNISGAGSGITKYSFVNGDSNLASQIYIYNVGSGKAYVNKGTKNLDGRTVVHTGYVTWTSPYIYNLYYSYLQQEVSANHVSIGECSESPASTGYWFKNTIDSWCRVSLDNATAIGQYSTIVGGHLESGHQFEDILTWFKNEGSYAGMQTGDYANGVVPSTTPSTSPTTTTTSGGSGGGSTNTEEEACYKNAKSLGWVICPMMYGLNDVVKSIYSGFIEPMLQTHESILGQLNSSSSSDLYRAWTIFRNMANIIFVIILLIVIFSQLTGFGIDNFGIKRILPKLIVTAILTNLSFILCAVAIDLSDILGKAIYDILITNAGSFTISNSGVTISTPTAIITGLVEALIAVMGGATAVVAVMTEGWAIVLPILLLLLSGLIAAFFLMVVLGVRQAMIVLMIVISPVAVVLYALPNTNNLFKKYINMFSSLLLTYPAASLLIGGGYFVAKIILSGGTDSVFILLSAGLLSIAPYFFIPTLVQNSLRALGNLGGMITSLGNKASGKITGGINNGVRGSSGYKAYQQKMQGNKANRDAAAMRRSANRTLSSRFGLPNGANNADVVEAMRNGKLKRDENGIYYDGADGRRIGVSNGRIANINRALTAQGVGVSDALQARQRMSNNDRNTSAEGFNAGMAAVKDREQAEAIKDYETSFNASDMSIEQLGNQFDEQLRASDNDVDVAKFKALMNTLSKTDAGRTEMKNKLAKDGAGMGKTAESTFKQQMGGVLGAQVKGQARSLYDYATKMGKNGSSRSFADYRAGASESSFGDKIKAGNLDNYDPGELEDALKSYNQMVASGATDDMINSRFGNIRKAFGDAQQDSNIHLSNEYQKFADGYTDKDGNTYKGFLDGYTSDEINVPHPNGGGANQHRQPGEDADDEYERAVQEAKNRQSEVDDYLNDNPN